MLVLGSGLPLLGNAQPTPPPPLSAPPQAEKIPTAAESTAPRPAPAAGTAQVNTNEHGVRYLSGGVSEDERQELRALSNQFNLELMFAAQGGGEYMADVQVRILDSKGGIVLDALSKGPYFLAQLPTGAYTVTASANNQNQQKTAQIGSAQSKLSFYWR